MSVFVHAQGIKTVHDVGEGVKKGQNSDHVLVECPPSTMALLHCILLKYLNLHQVRLQTNLGLAAWVSTYLFRAVGTCCKNPKKLFLSL